MTPTTPLTPHREQIDVVFTLVESRGAMSGRRARLNRRQQVFNVRHGAAVRQRQRDLEWFRTHPARRWLVRRTVPNDLKGQSPDMTHLAIFKCGPGCLSGGWHATPVCLIPPDVE